VSVYSRKLEEEGEADDLFGQLTKTALIVSFRLSREIEQYEESLGDSFRVCSQLDPLPSRALEHIDRGVCLFGHGFAKHFVRR
jgi:hypothetical protein